jgi:hypothetical protein
VGDGLVLLPLSDETREQLEWLATGVLEAAGEASVWIGEAATLAQEEDWMHRIRDASAEEFDLLRRRAVDAMTDDTAARRRSLRQLRAELRRIRTRDYFGARAGATATAAIERLARLEPASAMPS